MIRLRMRVFLVFMSALIGVSAVGCRNEMYDQPRYEPMEPSSFFKDGLSARPLVEGTIPRGWDRLDEHLFYGRVNGELAASFPEAILEDLESDRDREQFVHRGQELFNAFCLPCHGGLGNGRGMIVERGMPMPPSFHEERLIEMPVGHFYDVISRGYGAMYSYEHRIKPHDRWAVVAYIRALQRSQNTPIGSLSDRQRELVTQSMQTDRSTNEAGASNEDARPEEEGQ